MHAFHAHRARADLNWSVGVIEHEKRKIPPPISEDWAAGCDLRLMSPAKDRSDIPTEGKNLIVVADSYGVLDFRIFDGDGKIILDYSEGMETEDFMKQFSSLWPPHELTGIEKRRAIASVTSILGRGRARLQAHVRGLQARQAEAVAKAEYHERLARRP